MKTQYKESHFRIVSISKKKQINTKLVTNLKMLFIREIVKTVIQSY